MGTPTQFRVTGYGVIIRLMQREKGTKQRKKQKKQKKCTTVNDAVNVREVDKVLEKDVQQIGTSRVKDLEPSTDPFRNDRPVAEINSNQHFRLLAPWEVPPRCFREVLLFPSTATSHPNSSYPGPAPQGTGRGV